ncbi:MULTISPECIES: cytochrome b [Pseudomonas]|uniref:Cytochrome b561 family protein n=1 Tax=Pseudomonas chlororaphis O6 TaxID=1037915 RepID=A0AB33WK38_9PSED|nr:MULTISPECIES: cytochrome b/b6 domain-containing protein [Pseudomonas]AZC59461.1 Cytochrome B561 [Pseudomonas chlororaphis subsp. piscium]AZD88417.1 Cytochrome B561 [Pseudomonas chlororaphis subsp. aureofaciens]AZD94830.1 Cytochrome B561 [Pseudomonas chlororaphis subsp. aureofaciens]AZE01157.1 Cytochrome B561 [Pseudomonas chlororaphis subsp. aureofaciens]EIM13384.1 cytochrome b561 family protein [Pseudomonas chlororaphis O6]
MNHPHYSRPRRLLHWLFAAVVLWATISGYTSALLQPSPSVRQAIAFINVSLTTLLVPLFVLRLFYLVRHPAPPAPAHQSAGERRLVHAGHAALLVTLGTVLFSGVLMMSRPIDLFGLQLPQPLQDPAAITFFEELHHYSCMALALLVAGHIAAVILHQLRGHGVLRRMLPKRP